MRVFAAGVAVAGLPLVVIPGHPSIRPWPIGAGPGYRPAATTALVDAGAAVGALRCARYSSLFPFHLEIFAFRRAVVVPSGIGIAKPRALIGASVSPLGCTYPLSTRTPAGIVWVGGSASLSLGDLFHVWGLVLNAHRIGAFASAAPVHAYLDGRVVRGSVAAIPLERHDEIVLELGGYVAPHPFFLFTGGGS